ncbi:hypothetical protein BJ138DRAFT_1120907 [Hygrophoropsis aurantiaca]|uniref:Uncharacterized protein n=1 Tax=Hygrophoropsis aurantiaca TaxID=72124 RepID=A0ACB7ZPD9_9AGAM|nr:hypothetical protein BJ138DRAFT_1120907 [Hygrophoropsis aurantiaca]
MAVDQPMPAQNTITVPQPLLLPPPLTDLRARRRGNQPSASLPGQSAISVPLPAEPMDVDPVQPNPLLPTPPVIDLRVCRLASQDAMKRWQGHGMSSGGIDTGGKEMVPSIYMVSCSNAPLTLAHPANLPVGYADKYHICVGPTYISHMI